MLGSSRIQGLVVDQIFDGFERLSKYLGAVSNTDSEF